MLGEAVFYPN